MKSKAGEFVVRHAATRHRVVIVGGGFGGLRAARALARLPIDVTLIDRNNHHVFQPLLYQVATGVLSEGQVAPALRSFFRRRQSVQVQLGEVRGFDLARHVVRTWSGRELEVPYDTLIVAAGASHSYFGHDEWGTIAPGIKTLDDANRLRSRILGAFEMAELSPPGEERDAWLTFVVIGGGATGVELAGQLSVLSRRILRGEYRAIDPTTARILLLDAGPSVLPMYGEHLSVLAEQDLRDLGIDVQLGVKVVGVDEDGVTVESGGVRRRISARTAIWAAGVRASPLADALAEVTGAERDRAGRLRVGPELTLPNHPEVFVIGDMAAIPNVPSLAPAAMQQGAYVSRLIESRLRGKPLFPPFRYVDRGSMATIGRGRAVGSVLGVDFWGVPAFLAWGAVHFLYLPGLVNRLGALARWMWTALARDRRERLISVVSLVGDKEAHAQIDVHLRSRREVAR
jgi:NADH dehydrogenase